MIIYKVSDIISVMDKVQKTSTINAIRSAHGSSNEFSSEAIKYSIVGATIFGIISGFTLAN